MNLSVREMLCCHTCIWSNMTSLGSSIDYLLCTLITSMCMNLCDYKHVYKSISPIS